MKKYDIEIFAVPFLFALYKLNSEICLDGSSDAFYDAFREVVDQTRFLKSVDSLPFELDRETNRYLEAVNLLVRGQEYGILQTIDDAFSEVTFCNRMAIPDPIGPKYLWKLCDHDGYLSLANTFLEAYTVCGE